MIPLRVRAAALNALVLAVVAAALAVVPAHAAAPAIVSATASPSTATVGDRITLTIVIDHDDGTIVADAGFGADTGPFEIIAVPPLRTEPHNGLSRTTIVYALAAFSTGALTIPPQRITYTEPGGSSGTLTTDPITVTIQSVLAPGETELRPLNPQLDLQDPAPPPFVPVLFVAGLAALTAVGYTLMRRAAAIRPVPALAPAAAPALAPHETARAALDAIAGGDLAATDIAEYYARIAATVRAYLSARFDFPAYAMTRSEMERGAAAAGIDRWPARLTANLLEQCDAVQFAAFRPAPERRTADLTAAYEIVDLTTTVPALM